MSASTEHQTFYGLIPVRIVFAACALTVMSMGAAMPWLGPEDQPNDTLGEYVALGALMTFCFIVGAAALAICLERLVVDDEGVHRRNPIWFDRSTPWDQVLAADLGTDFNTHPVLTTSAGRMIRLRGAASLLPSSRSTAVRAHEAIQAHLDR